MKNIEKHSCVASNQKEVIKKLCQSFRGHGGNIDNAGLFLSEGNEGSPNRREPDRTGSEQLTMGLWRPPVLPSSLEADLVLMRSTLQAHEITNTTLKHMRSKFRHVACHTRPLAFADLIIFPTFSSSRRVCPFLFPAV